MDAGDDAPLLVNSAERLGAANGTARRDLARLAAVAFFLFRFFNPFLVHLEKQHGLSFSIMGDSFVGVLTRRKSCPYDQR